MATDDPQTATVPGRYASALFDLAKEQNQVADVERDLIAFRGMLDESDDLERLVRSPIFTAHDQIGALSSVLDKAEISGLTAKFLKLIARNRRLFAVSDMITTYRSLASADRGEVPAEVTSAVPLDDAQVASIKDKIKASIGQDVQLDTSVDPSILGGLIVKVGSRMIDSSLRTKLSLLKTRMKEAH